MAEIRPALARRYRVEDAMERWPLATHAQAELGLIGELCGAMFKDGGWPEGMGSGVYLGFVEERLDGLLQAEKDRDDLLAAIRKHRKADRKDRHPASLRQQLYDLAEKIETEKGRKDG